MNYYSVPLVCGDCNAQLTVEKIGVSADYQMAVNFNCPRCCKSGGVEISLIDLCTAARNSDAIELQ